MKGWGDGGTVVWDCVFQVQLLKQILALHISEEFGGIVYQTSANKPQVQQSRQQQQLNQTYMDWF